MIRIGVLTSSRADYGIYKPLLQSLANDSAFELSIIAFGTHLSHFHGYTLQGILDDGFEVRYKVNSMLLHDDANSISTACALTALKFADFWNEHAAEFDVVFCLGDRYEMFGAVTAGIPFNVKFAHIHGGETTLGAIDNIYRHAITLASTLHFVAQDTFAKRVADIVGETINIFVTGALSLDNLDSLQLLTKEAFELKWNIDLNLPTVLVTIHPETVAQEKNQNYLREVLDAINFIAQEYQVVITLPNADTNGSIFREGFYSLKNTLGNKLTLIENFGTQSYFSCMRYCKFLFGNTSSGIIEAASFNKYVINIGDRQKGRLAGANVVHVPFEAKSLKTAISKIIVAGEFNGKNPYYKGGAAKNIINILKTYNSSDKL